MCKERIFLLGAGGIICLGVLLGVLLSPWWLVLSAFIGLNMMQASFTGFCGMTRLLTALKVDACQDRTPFR